jgi:hypothetical protein
MFGNPIQPRDANTVRVTTAQQQLSPNVMTATLPVMRMDANCKSVYIFETSQHAIRWLVGQKLLSPLKKNTELLTELHTSIHKLREYNGFLWFYTTPEQYQHSLDAVKRSKRVQGRPIIVIGLSMNKRAVFPSLREAARELRLPESSIRDHMKVSDEKFRGCFFRYYGEQPITVPLQPKRIDDFHWVKAATPTPNLPEPVITTTDIQQSDCPICDIAKDNPKSGLDAVNTRRFSALALKLSEAATNIKADTVGQPFTVTASTASFDRFMRDILKPSIHPWKMDEYFRYDDAIPMTVKPL